MARWKMASWGVVCMVLLGLGAVLALGQGWNGGSMVTAAPIAGPALGDPATDLLISAVHRGLSGFGGKDEAFRITNVSTATIVLTETWRVRDDGGDVIAFPAGGVTLTAGASIWCARNALSFTLAFGFPPWLEYGENASPEVPDMSLNDRFGLADGGGSVTLFWVALLDTANGDGGGWPAGSSASGDRRSMERIDPTAPDDDTNWATAVMTTGAHDANGNDIGGSPRCTNTVYVNSGASDPPIVVINEVAWAGTNASSADEWIELYNNTGQDVDLDGWMLAAADGRPSIQLTGVISAHGFYLLERTDDTTVNDRVADQIYTGALGNSGEELRLYYAHTVDVLVYGNADPARLGWSGDALQPYANGVFAGSGQILFRARDEATGLPLPDSNSAADWANDTAPGGALYGPVDWGDLGRKRVMYPGWDWDVYTHTWAVTATARLSVAIAPDNAYTAVAALLGSAQSTILIEGYTFESVWLTGILTGRIAAGVQVTMLLEGAPAGGLPEQQLWSCKQIVDAGGAVYFMHNDAGAGVFDRYTNQHAKLIIVDGKRALVSSENFGNHAMPVDGKANGTAGNRGVLLITDQPDVVRYLGELFGRDLDPRAHADIVAYGALARYTLSPTYTAVYSTGGGGYGYMAPFSVTMPAFTATHFEIVHSPESSLRYSDGLIALLLRAGSGDELYVEQMYERVHWGPSSSGVDVDPNPRLEAYIQAARQGARVRVLLDKGFDDERKNYETAFYLLAVAQSEGLDLEVRLGNPTLRGIHNKMALLKLGARKFVHVGSINGSESSSKANREIALQVCSGGAYDYLRDVFAYDWAHSGGPYEVYLPLAFNSYVPKADHLLISEVVFNLPGADDLGEWVELYNPTPAAVEIGGWYLGDAVRRTDYERLYVFPAGTTIPPSGTLVIARRATSYQALGYASQASPDLEWDDSSDSVPNMTPCSWGEGEFALGNAGDQVLLFDAAMRLVDAVVYGSEGYAGVVSFGDVSGVYSGDSLERWPANRDSNDCRRDFRILYNPEPGRATTW